MDSSGLDELVNGAETISSKTAELDAGVKALVAKNDELKKGSADIVAGITTVTGGLAGIYEGINKLSENNDTLVTGAETLEKSGAISLHRIAASCSEASFRAVVQ